MSMIGTPFLHQGRRPDTGLDCVGLVIACYERAGFRTSDCRIYRRRPPAALLDAMLQRNGLRAHPPEHARDGDVLTFAFGDAPRHAGIAAGGGMVHVAWGRPVALMRTLTDGYRDRLRAAWRVA